MNPSPNRQAVIVGVFVTIAIAILAGGILTIGNLNDTFTHKIIVSTVFDEVNGLKKGDNIWFSGLKVGIVKGTAFHGVSQVEVQMRIDEEATPFIHSDALVKIGSDGLIGNRILVLYAGTPEAPTLRDGDVLTVGETTSTDAMMAMLQDNNKNLLAITTDIKGITAKINAGEGTLGKLVNDPALYASVSDSVASLGVASTNAKSLTASLAAFTGKLNREGGLPNAIVTDRTSYASLTGTVADLKHAGERASSLMDGLASGAADPNSALGALTHDSAAAANLKGTLDNLNQGSGVLNEDLEALKHNIFFRRYFRLKARADAKAAAEANR